MRNKLLFFFMFPLWIMGQTALANVVALPMDTAKQQAEWLQEEENTTIENGEKSQSADNAEGGYVPTISYTDIPREYEIADVTVTGANNYDKSVIIGYSGLSKGQKIKVPGDQISQAIKKFWKQGLFSDVEISASKIDGQKIWLNIALKTRERISDIVLRGVKDKDKEDMLSAMELKKGGQLTPNLIARTKAAIKRHLAGEGYRNADVNIWVKNDPSAQGSVIVNIGVDRKEKVRVNHIYITGNSQMEEKKIKRAMKKTVLL